MLEYFNQEASLGSMYKYKLPKNKKQRGSTSQFQDPLVEILAYCLNKNHYHLLLKQVADNGISKFMQKIGTGYTMYFNQKNKRMGALFAGRFKSKHVDTDSYLHHVGVYVNLNNRVHQKSCQDKVGGSTSVLQYVSSWNEYMDRSKLKLCNKEYLLAEFKDANEYKSDALETLKIIIKNKEINQELENE